MSPDGTRVFVTGYALGVAPWPEPDPRDDFSTAAFDAATGDLLWAATYDGPGHDYDWADAVAVSPDGSKVFVTGRSPAAQWGFYDYATLAYHADTGEELWIARYDGPGNDSYNTGDFSYGLAVSPDGARIFVTGQTLGSGTGYDFGTVAYDSATGEEAWVAHYNGPANGHDLAWRVAASTDGTAVFVTGRSPGPGTGNDYATIAYDATDGTPLWVTRYDGVGDAGADNPWALGVSADGARVFVTGESAGHGTGKDYATLAYDTADGTVVWTARHDAAGGNDVANALAVAPDASTVYVTGASAGTTGNDYATLAYDAASGSELWVARYDGPTNAHDAANALAVSPDNATVFVTGSSSGTTATDYATIAYDTASGSETWTMRYDGSGGHDSATAVAVAPDGSRVIVTGRSVGDGTGFDYTTIAYTMAERLIIRLSGDVGTVPASAPGRGPSTTPRGTGG